MYLGATIEMQMEKIVCENIIFDNQTYVGSVLEYNQEEEYFCVALKSHTLTGLSLDAKYKCCIIAEKEKLCCTGRVKERYQNINGNVFIFRIENGFYNL